MSKAKAGGYTWRQELVELSRDERSELEALKKLLRAANTPDTSDLIISLIEGKLRRIERIDALKQLGNGYDSGPESE